MARGPVYDRATAAKDRVDSTGHGLPYPNPDGPLARHLVLEGGESSLEDLIVDRRGDSLIRLGDIAVIELDHSEIRSYAYFNGEPILFTSVNREAGSNVIATPFMQ